MTDFPAIGHVAVTVKDLSVSRPWYRRLIGADPVLDEPTDGFHHTVFLISGTLIGLHQHPGTGADDTFTELRTGLDHIAFACADRAELASWESRLDHLEITHGASSTPTTVRASASETPTASLLSSSPRRGDPPGEAAWTEGAIGCRIGAQWHLGSVSWVGR